MFGKFIVCKMCGVVVKWLWIINLNNLIEWLVEFDSS